MNIEVNWKENKRPKNQKKKKTGKNIKINIIKNCKEHP